MKYLILLSLIFSACAKSNDSIASVNSLKGEYLQNNVSTCSTTGHALVIEYGETGQGYIHSYLYDGTDCSGNRTKFNASVEFTYDIQYENGETYIVKEVTTNSNETKFVAIKRSPSEALRKTFGSFDDAMGYLSSDWSGSLTYRWLK